MAWEPEEEDTYRIRSRGVLHCVRAAALFADWGLSPPNRFQTNALRIEGVGNSISPDIELFTRCRTSWASSLQIRIPLSQPTVMFRAQQNAFDDAIGERQAKVLPYSEYLMPLCSKGYGRESDLRELGVNFGDSLSMISNLIPSLKIFQDVCDRVSAEDSGYHGLPLLQREPG